MLRPQQDFDSAGPRLRLSPYQLRCGRKSALPQEPTSRTEFAARRERRMSLMQMLLGAGLEPVDRGQTGPVQHADVVEAGNEPEQLTLPRSRKN